MSAPSIDLDKPLELHEISFLDDGDEVTVGRPDIDSFGSFPPDGAALLRRLVDGVSPRAAAVWYLEKYGEPVDMVEFLEVLEEFEFLVRPGEQRAVPREVRWQRLGRIVFSAPACVLFVAVLAVTVVAMWRTPDLAPHYRNIFFTPSLVVLQLTFFVGQIPLVLLHESFHALAGRRLGLHSRLRIGRRYYFLVFETALDGLVTVPRRQRYLPILAGMIADTLVICVFTLIAATTRAADGELSAAGRVCLAFAFVTVLRLVWQFYLFLRTDLYYLVTTVLGCNDLQTVTGQLMRNTVNRILGRIDALLDESNWHPRDHKVARWYSWLVVAGYGFLTASLLLAIIPTVVTMISIILGRLSGAPTSLGLLDATVFLAITVGQLAIAGVAHRRGRAARRSSTQA